MSALWTSNNAEQATGGVSSAPWRAQGVSIDSRTIAKDDLFVALKGPTHDGHDHAAKALEAGAAAALVHQPMQDVGTTITVDDSFVALNELGLHRRDAINAKVIGVTGSVGKTGTKEMLRQLLHAQGNTHASAASHNNHWGVPLTLARTPKDCRFLVVEMGMNAPGEIRALSTMARPHVAIITQVAAAHLEFFNSVSDIADAKAEIIEGIEPDGIVILPADNDHIDLLKTKAKQHGINVRTFGKSPTADWRMIGYQHFDDGVGGKASIVSDGQEWSFSINLAGEHLAMNALAALAAIDAAGADAGAAAEQLRHVAAMPGRGGREQLNIDGKRILLIDESYNANPVSMKAALSTLASIQGRKIAVLADMLELGATSDSLHGSLHNDVEAARLTKLILVGPHMKSLAQRLAQNPTKNPDCLHTEERNEAESVLMNDLRDGDVLLIKGSNGMRLTSIVQSLKQQNAKVPGPNS